MTETTAIDLKPQDKALQSFEVTKAAIAELTKKYGQLTVPTGDKKAYKDARAALTDLVSRRTSVDKRRKELGADARDWINNVNSTAKMLIDLMAPTEQHLRDELGKEDDRIQAEKEAKEKAERERIESIRNKISSMTSMVANLGNIDRESLERIQAELNAVEINPGEYMEMTAEANLAKQASVIAVMQAIENRRQIEREEAERKAEAERLEKMRKEQEEQAAELERRKKALEDEERIRREAAEKADAERRARIAAEEAERRAKIEAEESSRRAKIEAEEADRKAKADALEKERQEFERKQREDQDRKDREALEARLKVEAEAKAKADAEAAAARAEAERIEREKREAEEKARQEALRPDKDKLIAWATGFLSISSPEGLKDASAISIAVDGIESICMAANAIIDRAKAL